MHELVVWILVGLVAQLIDGTLGMAYGVTSTAVLLTVGVYPALASASVHAAEVFTTLVSGTSHLRFGNVDRDMVRRLVMPGIIGGITGAYVSTAISGTPLSGIVGFVLLAMGFMILCKFAFKRSSDYRTRRLSTRALAPLGYVAAFADAIGGGGWGPIATTTLVASDVRPSQAIGSVNLSEFFVTAAETITFAILIGPENFNWMIVLGLMIGGLICAPVAALLCKKVPNRALGIFVGVVIMILSIRTILKFTGLV